MDAQVSPPHSKATSLPLPGSRSEISTQLSAEGRCQHGTTLTLCSLLPPCCVLRHPGCCKQGLSPLYPGQRGLVEQDLCPEHPCCMGCHGLASSTWAPPYPSNAKSQSPSTLAWCPMAPQDPHLVEVVGIRAWLLPHPCVSVSPTTPLPFPCSSTCPNSPQSQPAWHMDPTTHSHPLHHPNNLTPAPHLPPGLLGCPWSTAGLCGTPLWGSVPSAPLQLKPSPSSIPWASGWRVAVPVPSSSLCHLTVEESPSKVLGYQGLGVQTWRCQHGPMVPLRRTRGSLGADSRQSAASNPSDPVPTAMSP